MISFLSPYLKSFHEVALAEGWQDVEDFGKAKVDYLRQFFPFKHGIPNDDTFRRFFRALNPEQFQSLFRDWVRSFQPNLDPAEIAIDGKSSHSDQYVGSGAKQ